jgi:hypothetical protein
LFGNTELLLPFGEFRMCGSQYYGLPGENRKCLAPLP